MIFLRTPIFLFFLMSTAIVSGQKLKNEPSVGENLDEINYFLSKDHQSCKEMQNKLNEDLMSIFDYKESAKAMEELKDCILINIKRIDDINIGHEIRMKELYLSPAKRIIYREEIHTKGD